jgi:hypothetical protein
MTNQDFARSGGSKGINRFCEDEDISRSALYKLWKEGRGPRYFNIGNRRHISDQAAAEWRARMEAVAENVNQ